ncbi:MAG: response regulator [Acidobacteriota bacterium]|jgi:putative two-component system response regulator|nr:response regulator [Acidobacteriota bacterium]
MEPLHQRIILVDDNFAILSAGKQILKSHYSVYPITSGEELFGLLRLMTPDLILLDIEMPDMDGYAIIGRLKANPATTEIPVIFLTSRDEPLDELKGLTLGAADYISKPFSPPLLLKRIENILLLDSRRKELAEHNDDLRNIVWRRTVQVVELQNAILNAMAELVEVRDNVTGGHIGRIQQYLTLLVNKLLDEKTYWEDVSAWDLELIVPSAQLHDVGKIAISDAILNKPGSLTPEEFDVMKRHTTFGEDAIATIMQNTSEKDFLRHAKIFAGTHHEKWDGSGYPRGLAGCDIPLEGRLMAIADVYDAIISPRSYKPAMPTSEAERIILGGRGTHFDPALVDLFADLAPQFAKVAEYCKIHSHKAKLAQPLFPKDGGGAPATRGGAAPGTARRRNPIPIERFVL